MVNGPNAKDGGYPNEGNALWWWRSFLRRYHISGGAKLYRNAIQYETSPVAEYLTPHYLRHTYATGMFAAGVDEAAKKHFFGHSSKDVTYIYRKMTDKAFDRALSMLDDYYSAEYDLK